jgi:hypothetical protein
MADMPHHGTGSRLLTPWGGLGAATGESSLRKGTYLKVTVLKMQTAEQKIIPS